MRHVLPFFIVCFCSGAVVLNLIGIPFIFIYALTLILLIASLFVIKKNTQFVIFSVLTFIFLGGAALKNSCILPRNSIFNWIYYKSQTLYCLKGFIKDYPSFKNGQTEFTFSTEGLILNNIRYSCSGDVLVFITSGPKLSYGEELLIVGNLRRPYFIYSDNILGVMHIKLPNAITRLNRSKANPLMKASFFFKKRIEGIIHQYLSPVSAGIVDAMILGDKKDIPFLVYDSMVKTGTVHILVVSGFNVGLVAFIIMLLFKVLRIPRIIRFYLAIFCIIAYCFVTGSSTPVLRASIMGVFFLLGIILNREPDIYNSISLSALFILLLKPKEIFSVSFQLSFASVISIVYFYPKFNIWLRIKAIKARFLRAVFNAALVSLSAWIGTFGFIAYNFKICSLVTILANMFIVPLAALITLSGLSMLIISMISPQLAQFIAYSNELWVVSLLKINQSLLKLPFAYLYL